jgi:hypothetical protein
MAATSAANIAEALVIIPPGSIRWARRPTSSRWHLQVRSRVIRPGATQAAGPEAVSAGPARQFCARDSLGSGANPETCRRTRTWPARGPRANTPAPAQSMWGARHPLSGYLTARSQPDADRPFVCAHSRRPVMRISPRRRVGARSTRTSRGRSQPAVTVGAHASAACAVPFRYVRGIPDQVQRESSQRATTPVCPKQGIWPGLKLRQKMRHTLWDVARPATLIQARRRRSAVAEDARFELARGCPQHAFQQCWPPFTIVRHRPRTA